MTDTPLLRMARIVAHLTWNTYADGDARTAEAEQLVRDLEAAESMRLRLADSTENEAPARRTITREEFNAARVLFLDEDMTSSEVMTAVAAAWRLAVEDA